MSGTAGFGKATRLMVATPLYGGAQAEYVGSIVALMQLAANRGLACDYLTAKNNPSLTRARNSLVAAFLASDASHLMFVDDDIGFDAADVLGLVERMASQDELAVLGAPCPRRETDWAAISSAAAGGSARGGDDRLALAGTRYAVEPLQPGGALKLDRPFELAKLGSGLMIVRRDVFESLADRHPELAYRQADSGTGAERRLTAFFMPMIEPETELLLTDDYAFSRRARDAGFRLWAAPWMKTTHTGPATFTASMPDLAAFQSNRKD